ncbi:MAG: WD40 repeat domain-containing protein [Spirulinaceae cyanobacterium RM2_2_10]|nr:WD40 repeat domain-containing protein [Spirulinaceae cyanobacterium RM2_2_10]
MGSPRPPAPHTDGSDDELRAVAWHPSGEQIAAGGPDRTVWLWQREGQRREQLSLAAQVNAIAFSPDGQYLAAASDDHQVWLWQADADGRFDTQPPRQFTGHTSWVLDVAFVPPALQAQFATPPLLASASYDNTIRFWSATGQTLRELRGHTDSVAKLQFGPMGAILATITWNNAMQAWTVDDTLLKTWEGHRERVTSLSWSPDGSAIATASEDGTALVWELNLADLRLASCQWLRDYLRHNPRVPERDQHLCD